MKSILSYLGDYIRHVDKLIPIICIGLSVFDIYILYTLSYDNISTIITKESTMTEVQILSMVKTQLISAVLGVCASAAISLIDYKFLSKIWFVYAPIAMILQLLLFVPGLGIKRDDDLAWLDLKFITIQPSEILKFVFILTLATHISKIGDKINSPKHLLLVCVHALVPIAIIMKQGDAGSALVFIFVFVCMLFMAGISWKYMVAALAAVPPILFVAWNYIMKPHHRLRFLILFDKEMQEAERLDKFYQQYYGTVALGSGQLKGLGFDADNYTSTAYIWNDFIFSYIGMTLGFIGCMCLVIAFAVLCMKILSDASGAQDLLGKLICVGVFAMVFFHCVINIGMVLCVIPIIGIPLPFISQGGTSMIMMHASMGLVLSVTAHREKAKHMFYTEKK